VQEASGMKTILTLSMLALGSAVACGGNDKPAEGPAEQAGKDVDEAAKDTKEAAEDASEKAGQKAEEAGDAIEEGTKDEK
jgi:hypothetical protein